MLCCGDVVIGSLNQLQQDIFYVLSHISGLRYGGGIGNGEGHAELGGKGSGQQGLSCSGRSHDQDVGLVQRDVVVLLDILLELDSLVVVVDCDAQDLLCLVLSDDVLVQILLEFVRGRKLVRQGMGRCSAPV